MSEAEEENGQSRIYLGIHWTFDKTEGIAQGRKVADYVFDRIVQAAGPLVSLNAAETGACRWLFRSVKVRHSRMWLAGIQANLRADPR